MQLHTPVIFCAFWVLLLKDEQLLKQTKLRPGDLSFLSFPWFFFFLDIFLPPPLPSPPLFVFLFFSTKNGRNFWVILSQLERDKQKAPTCQEHEIGCETPLIS